MSNLLGDFLLNEGLEKHRLWLLTRCSASIVNGWLKLERGLTAPGLDFVHRCFPRTQQRAWRRPGTGCKGHKVLVWFVFGWMWALPTCS